MIKIYIIAGIVLIITAAYWAGSRNGAERCRADMTTQQQNMSAAFQKELTSIKGKINEETYRTTSVDIRGRLRDKYTIKD